MHTAIWLPLGVGAVCAFITAVASMLGAIYVALTSWVVAGVLCAIATWFYGKEHGCNKWTLVKRIIVLACVFLPLTAVVYLVLAPLQTRPILEPVVEVGIGKPFAISTIITINNGGPEPVKDVAVNIRCIFFNSDNDPATLLLFEGFPSMGSANSWWRINTIGANASETKDAVESIERCLSNSEKEGRVYARQIFVADLSYRRSADNKEYKFSAIADLARDQKTGKPFLWPEHISDFYRRILDNNMAPAFR